MKSIKSIVNNDNVIIKCNSKNEVLEIAKKLRRSPNRFISDYKQVFPIYIFRDGNMCYNSKEIPYISWSYHLNLIKNYKDRKVVVCKSFNEGNKWNYLIN